MCSPFYTLKYWEHIWCVCVCLCVCVQYHVSAWLNVKLCVHVGTVVQSHCDSVTGQNVHTVVTSFNPCTLYIIFRQNKVIRRNRVFIWWLQGRGTNKYQLHCALVGPSLVECNNNKVQNVSLQVCAEGAELCLWKVQTGNMSATFPTSIASWQCWIGKARR